MWIGFTGVNFLDQYILYIKPDHKHKKLFYSTQMERKDALTTALQFKASHFKKQKENDTQKKEKNNLQDNQNYLSMSPNGH